MNKIRLPAITIMLLAAFGIFTSAYELHDPIIIRTAVEDNSPSNPYIIEGYEITNTDGPCIFIEGVDHVIIRNNYLHDCGTDKTAEILDLQDKEGCVSDGGDFMETGALDVYKPKSVQVYNNKLINNDYGMRIEGGNGGIQRAIIRNNTVHRSHRDHFVWVKDAEDVEISLNDVRDNGLSELFDNVMLARKLAGEDVNCYDGRSQGIVIYSCNNVSIHGNFVSNSSSDGIGVMADPNSNPSNPTNPSTDVRIFDNEVAENGEQGIWVAGGHDVAIYRNKVYQSKHRKGETGGSSGIMLETNAYDIDIYENEAYYNDMFGILLSAGTNINIHNNTVYMNGDGGIGFLHLEYIGEQGINNITISGNNIHDNRRCAICIANDYFEGIIVEENVFSDNGGNPIHHESYPGNDFTDHPEDWAEKEFENVFSVEPEDKFSKLTIRDNIGYEEEKDADENHMSPDDGYDGKKKKKTASGASIGYGYPEDEHNFSCGCEPWAYIIIGLLAVGLVVSLGFNLRKRR
jgi:parallel beta-helix repeat protein